MLRPRKRDGAFQRFFGDAASLDSCCRSRLGWSTSSGYAAAWLGPRDARYARLRHSKWGNELGDPFISPAPVDGTVLEPSACHQ